MGKVIDKIIELFPTQSLIMEGTDVRRTHHVIHCSHCPETAAKAVSTGNGLLGLPELQRFFSRQGWYVGRYPRAHLCPSCNPTRQRAVLSIVADDEVDPYPQDHQQEQDPVSNNNQPTTREMTFSDRRIINAKLEEVYENDLIGYRKGWNDARVAQDLGTAIPWVTELRSANFGPATGNAVLTQLLEEQTALKKDMLAWRDEGASLLKRLQAVEAMLQTNGLAVAAAA